MRASATRTRTIRVDYLARVEGEGSLNIRLKDDQLVDVQLKVFEPPRFFEAMLRGRDFREAPDITARICGICPIAYLLGASQAMEDACGATVGEQVRRLRRLIYCGEWIESHALHIFMLHLPDFLGYADAVAMAGDHREVVERGLRIKKIGNRLMTLVGGREIHPINLRVGGFYKAPRHGELVELNDELSWGLEASMESARFLATLAFPDFEQPYEFVALSHPDEYAITEGRMVSNRGIDVPVSQYDRVLVEQHVRHSTALHSTVAGRSHCLMGPLARYSLNSSTLTPRARRAAAECGLGPTCNNPFKSILVRAVELVFAFEEAQRLIADYQPPEPAACEVAPRAGVGYGATEAPRGICYHRYTLDDRGAILDAKIVSPTAVNQKTIESDLWHFVEKNLQAPTEQLQLRCEQAIRNHDPCISCSTHFLKLRLERT